jgi:hypothetical protein
MLDPEKDDKDLEAGGDRAFEQSNIQPMDEEEAISDGETREKQEIELPLATKVRTVQDWDGPSDAENPMNWSLLKKSYHTAVPAFYGFAV